MKSISGINWEQYQIPDRLINKNIQNYNISYLFSKILLEKKYKEEEIYNAINGFNDDSLTYKNPDFIKAGEFIFDSLKKKKKILIFGDYDVDGYSSTYLLYDYLNKINIECDYYIPDRFIDGYGPNIKLLKKLIKKHNFNLIIFVDCGSNSLDEITFLEKSGLETIIIDHHQIYVTKKFNKTVIINPLKDFSLKKKYYFCATSLVFFFIKYLSINLKILKKIDLDKYLFFSAVATICDQMPMRMDNKIIVHNGLKKIRSIKFGNFNKLINLKSKITSNDIGFTLGPIINSASRLGQPDLPIRLLIERKKSSIDKLSNNLIFLNEKRKLIQKKTMDHFKDIKIEKENEVIFKYKENINEGLLGIIAANYVELYNKPSFVLTNSGSFVKCSSRSITGYDIGNIFYFANIKNIIIKGGGHSMAGGCILKRSKIDEFKTFLNTVYKEKSQNIKYFISTQNLESLLKFAKNELKKIEPFGTNNVNPFFLIKENKIVKLKVIKDLHLQIVIVNKFNKSCLCYAFNVIGSKLGDYLMNKKNKIDLIVQINNKIINKNSDFNLIIKDAIV